jgi:hypothetical protein
MVMSKPFGPNQGRDDSDEFLEDLESIKHLLDEEQQAQVEAAVTNDDVPLLDDQIGDNPEERLGDEAFNALLGDAWRDSVEEMFADARANIEANSTEWLPEHTDELAAALKVRIDASVRAWLAETLEANIHRLRERIVAELSEEILTHMRDKFGSNKKEDSGHDHG